MSLPPPPPRKHDDNAWMTTYADVITLLLAFFVILFSMSTLKKEFFNQITEEIVKGQKRGFTEQIRTLRPTQNPDQSPVVYRVFVPPLDFIWKVFIQFNIWQTEYRAILVDLGLNLFEAFKSEYFSEPKFR